MINAILPGSGKTYLVKSYATYTDKKCYWSHHSTNYLKNYKRMVAKV